MIDWCAVTGMARSGTTIVGDTLALGRRTVYLHEPFSPSGFQGTDWDCVGLAGEDLTPESDEIKNAIADALAVRGRFGNHVPINDPWSRKQLKRLIGGRGRVTWRIARLKAPFCRRGVIKDPFAWPFCPWLHLQHGVRVIIVVKHPVSQVASYARAGWRGDTSMFSKHPTILDQLDASDRRLMVDEHCSDAIACARQWRCLYRLLGNWSRRYGWKVVRIEDISDRPQEHFHNLFDNLGWEYPGRLDQVLLRRMGTRNPAEARPGIFQDLNRNSREIFRVRRASVAPEVRRQVFEETFEVARYWYDEASYDLRD